MVADQPITVDEKRTGSTCRKLSELLGERGIDFERVEYHVEGLPEETLRELLRKGGMRPGDVLRRREPLVAELERSGGDWQRSAAGAERISEAQVHAERLAREAFALRGGSGR